MRERPPRLRAGVCRRALYRHARPPSGREGAAPAAVPGGGRARHPCRGDGAHQFRTRHQGFQGNHRPCHRDRTEGRPPVRVRPQELDGLQPRGQGRVLRLDGVSAARSVSRHIQCRPPWRYVPRLLHMGQRTCICQRLSTRAHMGDWAAADPLHARLLAAQGGERDNGL